MSDTVLTEVTATVDASRVTDLVDAFEAQLREPTPDGLLRTELVELADGQWRIQTLWRDRTALDAMRSQGEPAAPALFRSVGAEPQVTVHRVVRSHRPHAHESAPHPT